MRSKKIYDIVQELKEKYETRDPFRLCKALDILVLYVPLVRVNGFYQHFDGQDIIYINQDLNDDEKTLVCAHELGHALLHTNVNTIFLETHKFVENKYEREADAFAINLLYEDLNLSTELPLVNWKADNLSLIKTVTKHRKNDKMV